MITTRIQTATRLFVATMSLAAVAFAFIAAPAGAAGLRNCVDVAGDLALINLGPGAVIVGAVNSPD